jgi:hypothetical protein
MPIARAARGFPIRPERPDAAVEVDEKLAIGEKACMAAIRLDPECIEWRVADISDLANMCQTCLKEKIAMRVRQLYDQRVTTILLQRDFHKTAMMLIKTIHD